MLLLLALPAALPPLPLTLRFDFKEVDQSGGLSDGQQMQINRNEKALKDLAEQIESLEETIFGMLEDSKVIIEQCHVFIDHWHVFIDQWHVFIDTSHSGGWGEDRDEREAEEARRRCEG